jgi:hypothetical protein
MRRFAALLLLLAGCAHAPRLPPGVTAAMSVQLTVRETGTVRVRLTVPAWTFPRTPERVRFVFPALPPGYPGHLPGLPDSAVVSSARDLQLDYEVPVLPLGASDPWPALHGCFQGPLGRQLLLGAVVPLLQSRQGVLDLAPATVTVEAPAPVTSSLEGRDGEFLARSTEELRSALVLVGRVREVVAADGLRLVSFDVEPRSLARAAALEARATASLERRYGPRSRLTLVALHRRPVGPRSAGVVGLNAGQTATVLVGGPLDGRATSVDGNVLVHELVHASLPPDHGLPAWMQEGITEYVSRQVGLELDRLPEEALREYLAATWVAFVESTPSRRPDDTAIGDYYGGAVLAHCVDVRLRRDASSLDAVLRRARARAGGPLTNDLWEQEIALASASAGALVVNARTTPLDPVETCFREEGYRLRPPRPGVRTGFLRSALGLATVDAEPRHVDVLALEVARGPLRAGDALLELDGTRILSLEHLRELLGRPTSGDWRLRVSREGELETVALPARPPRPAELGPVERAVWLRP